MRRLALLLALVAVPLPATAAERRSRGGQGALPARGAGRLREHARRGAGALRRRPRPRRGGRRRRPGRRAAAVLSAPTCSRAAARRSRGPRRSTATTASAARRRSRRCRRRRPARSAPPRRDARAAAGRGRSVGERRRRDLGARPDDGPLRGLPAGDALRGGVHRQARRARRRAARIAPGRAQPLVVRRAPDRVLVVEPRREPAAGEARLRRRRGRAAPARDDLEHVPRPVPGDDRTTGRRARTRA